MRRYLIVATSVMLVLIMVWGSGDALSSPGSEENKGLSYLHRSASGDQRPLSPVVDAADRLKAAGILDSPYFGGLYVDERTGTVHIGLTRMEGEHTEFIEAIVSKVEGVNVEFFEARFTMRELLTMESQIRRLFPPDQVFAFVDVFTNSVIFALKELTPARIAAIWEVVGEEAPIQIYEGWEFVPYRTGRHRPLLGGIQLATNLGPSTLGFPAVAGQDLGFVMTGHAGGVGDPVWQPTISTENYVGTIGANPLGHRFSDAAFVPSTVDIVPLVWPQRGIYGWAASYHTSPGVVVGKEGIATGYTEGIIAGYVSFWHDGRYLFHQVLATYESAPGDSGGPVFVFPVPPGDPNVVAIAGALVGEATIGGQVFSVYSPIEGIAYDLDLETPFSIQGVTGLVWDAYSGYPLQNAQIEVEGTGYWVYSDSGGYYEILLAPGTYTLTGSYPLFYSKAYTVEVVQGEFTTRNFALDPMYPGYPIPEDEEISAL